MRPVGEVLILRLKNPLMAWKWTLKERPPFDCYIVPRVTDNGDTTYKCLTSLGWTDLNDGDYVVMLTVQGTDLYYIFNLQDIERELTWEP